MLKTKSRAIFGTILSTFWKLLCGLKSLPYSTVPGCSYFNIDFSVTSYHKYFSRLPNDNLHDTFITTVNWLIKSVQHGRKFCNFVTSSKAEPVHTLFLYFQTEYLLSELI